MAGGGSSSFDVGLSSGHRDGFKKLLSEIASITSTHDESGGMTELDNYLREKLLPKDMELDLLVWWKTNGFKYPTLQRIAKDILAVPISTVASESAFSTSGRLISPHRSRLHPKTLEALMCAQSWLLNEIRETCSDESEAYCRSIDYDYDVEELLRRMEVEVEAEAEAEAEQLSLIWIELTFYPSLITIYHRLHHRHHQSRQPPCSLYAAITVSREPPYSSTLSAFPLLCTCLFLPCPSLWKLQHATIAYQPPARHLILTRAFMRPGEIITLKVGSKDTIDHHIAELIRQRTAIVGQNAIENLQGNYIFLVRGGGLVSIWSKMSTGVPIEIYSGMKNQNYRTSCSLDTDIHRYLSLRLDGRVRGSGVV
ncbi:hypothetical protein L1887_44285 [Cichorium endivia]|nr:hypothetical protein L1887_44285 [Cichorium endivia]